MPFSAGSANVPIVPDFRGAQKSIAEWFGSQRDMKINVQPDVDHAKLAAERASIESNHAKLHVDIDQDHLRQSFLSAVDQLTGISTVQSAFEKLFGPKSILVTSGVGALVALASSASQAAGAVALLPAGMAALAGTAATVAVGVQGVAGAFNAWNPTASAAAIKKSQAELAKLAPAARDFVVQVHSLGTEWHALQLDVQQHLFAGLGTTISQLGHEYLPVLRAGMVGVASSLNDIVKNIAGVMATRGNLQQFGAIWANIASFLHNLAPAAGAFVQALLTITNIGSQFLPGMASSLSTIAQRFAQFIQTAQQTGQLTAIIQRAVTAIKELGSIVGNLGGTIFNIFAAALPAGNQLIGLVNQLSGFLKTLSGSVAGQAGLRTFFNDIASAVKALLPGVEAIVTALVTGVLPQIGNLAKVLAPVVSSILTQFATMLQKIAPLIYPALANAIAVFVSAMAPVLPQLTQVAQVLFPALSRILTAISPSISQITTLIGEGLVAAVKILVPVLEVLATTILPVIADVLAALKPVLGPLAALILGIAAAMKVWNAIIAILNIELLGTPIGWVILAIGALVIAVVEIIKHIDFFKQVWNTVWNAVKDFFVAIWTSVRDFFVNTWNAIVAWFRGAAAIFVGFWVGIWNGIKTAFQVVWSAVSAVFQAVWNGIGTALRVVWTSVIKPVFDALSAAWNAVATFFAAVWEKGIKPVLDGFGLFFSHLWIYALQPLFHAIADGFAWMGSKFVEAWNAIVAFFTPAIQLFVRVWNATWTAIRDFFVAIWTAISTWFQGALNFLVAFWQAIWNGVSAFFRIIWTAIRDFFATIWNAVAAWFTNELNKFLAGWNVIWTAVKDFFGSIWNGIRDTAVNVWNAISGFFVNAFNVFKNFFNQIWTDIKNGFLAIWQGMVDGVKRIWEGIKAIFAVPINFVINTILNGGLFKAWNWIVDALHLPGNWKLHVDPIPGFRRGGYTGDAAEEAPAGVVHGKEFVFTARQTEKAGVDRLYAMADALDRGYSRGGYVDEILKLKGVPGFVGGGVVPGGQTWPKLWETIHGSFPNAVLTSAYRPGANDYHGLGQAIDVSFSGNPQSLLMPLASWIAQHFPGSTELIHNPNGSIKNGRPVPPSYWGAATWAAHTNHVHWAETPAALGSGGSAIGAVFSAIKGFFGEIWTSVTDVFNDLTNSITGPVKDLVSSFGDSAITKVLAAMPNSLLGVMWDTTKGAIGNALAALVGGGSNTPTDSAGLKSQAYALAQNFGWTSPGEQSGLDYIATHESGWNPHAQNPSSSASGIWQMIDGTWRAYRGIADSSFAHAKDAPSGNQDMAAFRYIRAAYGDPIAAQRHWAAVHSYDQGGWIPPGVTTIYNATGRPEPVLTAIEHDALNAWRSSYRGDDDDRRGLMRDVHIHHERGDSREIMDELWHRLKVQRRGGSYNNSNTVYVAG